MKFTINVPPRTKKNSQRLVNVKGRIIPIPSKQYQDFEKACGEYLPKIVIDYPVNIKCTYYMPTMRRVDLTNLLEATDDMLVRYGLLVDDDSTIVVSHDGSRVYYDKENPRTEIEITEEALCFVKTAK